MGGLRVMVVGERYVNNPHFASAAEKRPPWRSWRGRGKKALRNGDGKCFTRAASVLGFLLRPPARDAVRGFCATFDTKSGKEIVAELKIGVIFRIYHYICSEVGVCYFVRHI